MKRILSGLLIGILIIGLTGCGKSKSDKGVEKDNKVDVRNLYEQYLKDEKYKDEFTSGEALEYTYKDINSDGIEELIIGGTFEENRVRTLIISYNTDTKDLYKVYNLYSKSGLMYKDSDNTMLFIDRSPTTTIKYYYLKSSPNTEGVETIKMVSFKIGVGGLKITYPDGTEEDTTALDARSESENYSYVGFDHNIDGTTKEVTNKDIFADYNKDAYYVNDKKLSYGLYKAQSGIDLEISIYPDGTCRYNGVSNKRSSDHYNVSCTYETTQIENYGNMEDGILFKLNSGQEEEFVVTINDNMFSQWIDLNFVN